ncbi:response regulator [Nostoc sp. CHAB 5844]|nr:response regulator [Nostoc sp. CHAB 5844]
MSYVWTLLIADDCAEDREIYREYLLSDPLQSYQILEAASAEVGLALCQKKRCDAILLDFCLPDMSGLEFLDELKQQQLAVPLPVIMLTGQGDERVAVQAIKRGAQDYLVKQHLQPDVLQLTVRNVIQQTHQQSQLSKSQERQQLTAAIALHLHQSLNLEQILQTAVTEVQQLLECDRVTVYQVNPDAQPQLIQLCEAGSSSADVPIEKFASFLADNYPTSLSAKNQTPLLISQNRKKLREVYLLAPLLLHYQENFSTKTWGLLVACLCSDKQQWQIDETEIFYQLAEQLAVSIQQALRFSKTIELLEKEKHLNVVKSQLVTKVSYEYRTFLAAIVAAVSTLKQHSDKLSQAKHQRFLQIIEDKARQMSQLVDDLLVIETFEFGKAKFTPVPFELLRFFSDIIEEQRQFISEKHELSFKITGNTKGFWGDKRLLRQILVNLLANAIKYSPNGGNIEVHLMGDDSDISFYVKDEGIGIPIAEQEFLFPSLSSESNVGSTPRSGLGLAIVKACLELHGGKITLESEEDKGTKVSVSLPKRSQG